MDENEKSVLRRRKRDIANKLEVSRDLLKDLSARGLLSHDGLKDIECEQSNCGKAGRVVDTLLAVNPTNGFASFCSVLEHCGDEEVTGRMAHELETDLRLERGDIKPRQDLLDEAAILVHRKFGPSKRFSEADKREVSELIAVKLQLSQDDWRRQIDRSQIQLEELRTQSSTRDEQSQQIVDLLRQFVTHHENQLTSHAHDMTTTQMLVRQMMEDGPEDGNQLPRLQKNLTAFFHQVRTVLNHRDSLYHEKDKCLRLLGVQDDCKVQLDAVIGKLTGLAVTVDRVETKDNVIDQLQRRIDQLETQAERHDDQLTSYRKQLADKEREIAELRRHIHIS